MIEIRKETEKDYDAVRRVNDTAFGQFTEGRIVDRLRRTCKEIVSLVALKNDKIVGHILFSPVTIEAASGAVKGMGLAPMAVLPEFQNQGIGTLLVQEGLRMIKERSCPFVVVLGHESYYPRFGFERASKLGFKCQWKGVPDAAFMVLLLNKSVMQGISGTVKYREEFNEAGP